MIFVPSADAPPRTRLTVDGPTAAGKTTLGYGVAQSWASRGGGETFLLDTGMTYRAAGLALSRTPGLTPDEFRDGLLHLPALFTGPDTEPIDPLMMIWRDGDVTHDLRSVGLEHCLRHVAGNDAWRAEILSMHAHMADALSWANLVVVGRDTAITLMPTPNVAVYLTAELDTRRTRRSTQYAGIPNVSTSVGPETELDLKVRGALGARSWAIDIDSTHMTAAQVLTRAQDALAHAGKAAEQDAPGVVPSGWG
ncbi:(d)CMP kinase [Embleya sp. NBC_00896]|uniref:(d)CMP kinase n=1 Tax=Embleya sp. NBC_00896 TaxID=2975961 RepID=UPI002F90A9E2|nr:(d)CMP kinase [Embleya sp. NBC_00896]